MRLYIAVATGTNTDLAAGLSSAAYTVAFNVPYTYNYLNGQQTEVGTDSTGASTGTFIIVPGPRLCATWFGWLG